MPNPAPRGLALDAGTVKALADAEHQVGRLAGATGRLVNPYLVSPPLLRREAILSSRIEGTIATAEQLLLSEIGEGEVPPDTREVRNYVAAMEHGLGRLPDFPLSGRLLREMHRVLLDGVRGEDKRPGEFRQTQNFIGRRGDTIQQARFVPPPPAELTACIDDFERFLNEDEGDLPFLVRVAVAHYQFEAIHPFGDGNGRIGRLLIVLQLCARGRLPAPLLFLSAWFEKQRERYADLMLDVSRKGAFVPWVRFFLEGVASCAADALGQVEALDALRVGYRRQFESARSSALISKLIDRLFQTPAITIYAAAEHLRVTPAAASYNIRKLVGAGILREITGRKRDQVFFAHAIAAFAREGGGTPPEPSKGA